MSGFRQTLVNGSHLGGTICPSEVLQIEKPDGSIQKVVALYDNCGQNSSVHEPFAKEMRLKSKPLPHTLKTSTGDKSMPKGRVYEMKIRGGEGKEWKTVEANSKRIC